MATMMSKLAQKEQEKEVIIKFGTKEKRLVKDSQLAEAIELAYGFYKTFKDIDSQLKGQKKIITDKARFFLNDKGTVTFIVDTDEFGVVECKVTFQYEAVIPTECVEDVRRILGDRFNDLVRVKTVYTATPKLIELATDADRGKEIAENIVIKEKTAQISFR